VQRTGSEKVGDSRLEILLPSPQPDATLHPRPRCLTLQLWFQVSCN